MPVDRPLPFRSPLAKLVAFFRRSRDQWKEKCKAAKRQNKSPKLCLAKMKETQARKGERLLGSSEVLDSIMGKFECVAGERGRHGLTGMVLGIGALVGKVTPGCRALRCQVAADGSR